MEPDGAGIRTPDDQSPLNYTVTRLRTQTIPDSYPPGPYYYVGYAALNYGGAILDSSFFYIR